MQAFMAADSSRKNSEDRGEIFHVRGGFCLAIADGAGGISGGGEAASMFMQSVQWTPSDMDSRGGIAGMMMGADSRISSDPVAGETTGIVISLREGKLVGGSVGDSAAWLFLPASRTELTAGQRRKPFLGSDDIMPHVFSQEVASGTLVLVTDGLWKYTDIETIHETVRHNEPSSLPRKLIELVRLPSGTLQDDVCVIVCALP